MIEFSVQFPGHPLPASEPVMVPGFFVCGLVELTMVARFAAALELPLSKVRLESYRPPGADDLTMVVNYFHNIELSEALYPSLHAFEVALRNSVHAALSRRFQTEFWFDQPRVLLGQQLDAVRKARDDLTKNGKPLDSGHIVAELNLGFWHGVFNRPYEAGLWHANGAVLLAEVFPNVPRILRSRQTIWNRCDQIRRLRNRVMHHEPIWARPDLAGEHARILEALNWISGEMHVAIAVCDRFVVVNLTGRQFMTQKMKALIGI